MIVNSSMTMLNSFFAYTSHSLVSCSLILTLWHVSYLVMAAVIVGKSGPPKTGLLYWPLLSVLVLSLMLENNQSLSTLISDHLFSWKLFSLFVSYFQTLQPNCLKIHAKYILHNFEAQICFFWKCHNTTSNHQQLAMLINLKALISSPSWHIMMDRILDYCKEMSLS